MGWLRALAILAAFVIVGCTSGADSSTADLGTPPVILSTQDASDAAAEACGPDGRDRLYAEADTRDPATAARWFSERVELDWQSLVEEACYLALVNAEP